MTDISITREAKPSGGRYVIQVEGLEAYLTYQDLGENGRLTDHTIVPRQLGGRGIGTKLVERAVEDARAENKTIIPECWFVRQQIERHEDWQDVMKQTAR